MKSRVLLQMHPLLRPPVFLGAAFVVACSVTLTIGFNGSRRPQGEIPPTAPTTAEWAALPVDAPFTYRVTEIQIGSPRTDRILSVEPAAINNRGQVVGKIERVPAFVPFWWRRVFGLPGISLLAPRPPFGQTAFVWDAATGRAKTFSLPSGTLSAQAFDINDRGQVVGVMELPPQNPRNSLTDAHAVYWDDASASPQDIGAALAPLESYAYGINKSGQVRVRASGMAPNPLGVGGMHFVEPIYLWEKNTLYPTGAGGLAARINDKGEGVGFSYGAPPKRGSGGFLFLIAPNKPSVPLTDLNQKLRLPEAFVLYSNSGQIAGTDAVGPFVYAHGKLIRFLSRATSSAPRATVYSMNRNDDVVGYREHSPSAPPKGMKDFMPFLWRKNRLHNLNDLLGETTQWTVTAVYGINDRGQIVGFAQPVNPARRITRPSGGVYEHVVLLTPLLPSRAPESGDPAYKKIFGIIKLPLLFGK